MQRVFAFMSGWKDWSGPLGAFAKLLMGDVVVNYQVGYQVKYLKLAVVVISIICCTCLVSTYLGVSAQATRKLWLSLRSHSVTALLGRATKRQRFLNSIGEVG